MDVSIKVIYSIAIASVLMLSHSASATAEAYKTSKGETVVTGLTPTQRYQIRYVNLQGKTGSRQDKGVNHCGEIVIEKTGNYKTLIVGDISLELDTLPTKTHVKCPRKKAAESHQPKGVVRARTPEPR